MLGSGMDGGVKRRWRGEGSVRVLFVVRLARGGRRLVVRIKMEAEMEIEDLRLPLGVGIVVASWWVVESERAQAVVVKIKVCFGEKIDGFEKEGEWSTVSGGGCLV